MWSSPGAAEAAQQPGLREHVGHAAGCESENDAVGVQAVIPENASVEGHYDAQAAAEAEAAAPGAVGAAEGAEGYAVVAVEA